MFVRMLLRVGRGACVQDQTACALNLWAYCHASADDKAWCVLPTATAEGACGMMGAG